MPDAGAEDWDAAADTFDEPADHGLHDLRVRDAWRRLLRAVLPPPPARVADLGCGTGTLSVLLADEGHRVDGVDLSHRMLERAEAKAEGRSGLRFVHGDASHPPLGAGSYDVVLCRHVLWALPDPAGALRRWVDLLAPDGTMVLVEGRWSTGAGLPADSVVALLESLGRGADVTPLTDEALWGRPVTDERYVVMSSPGPAP